MPHGPFGEYYDPNLLRIAAEIRERHFPDPGFAPGLVVEHKDGYPVLIERGQFLGKSGPVTGISNFWTWHRIDVEGNKVGEPISGYGTELVSPNTAAIMNFPGRAHRD